MQTKLADDAQLFFKNLLYRFPSSRGRTSEREK
jgi:hypothetical protein